MNPKERFDACMREAEFAYKMHDGRRQWEWKLTLGLWAVILTMIIKNIRLPLVLWILLVVVYACLWVRPVWRANANNKVWYDYYMKEAAAILKNHSHTVGPAPGPVSGWQEYVGFLWHGAWSVVFRVLTTALLAYVAYAL